MFEYILGATALCASTALGWYMTIHEPFNLSLDERELTFDGLPSSLDGLRILFIGDLHIRQWDYRTLWVNDQIKNLKTDIVLFSGDIVEPSGIDILPEFLALLQSPMGTYMVPGNNENLEFNRDELFVLFRQNGVKILLNEAAAVNECLDIVGVDDPSRENEDLEKALSQSRDDSFRILLAHTPEIFPQACKAQIPLTLSGHTHGGQVRLPLLGALWTDTPRTGLKFDCGHFEEADSQMVVTRGVGMSKLPIRCLCSPQIHVLTLRKN
jgi:predicted MPP superfamily phosphohydrolase